MLIGMIEVHKILVPFGIKFCKFYVVPSPLGMRKKEHEYENNGESTVPNRKETMFIEYVASKSHDSCFSQEPTNYISKTYFNKIQYVPKIKSSTKLIQHFIIYFATD